MHNLVKTRALDSVNMNQMKEWLRQLVIYDVGTMDHMGDISCTPGCPFVEG